MRDPGSNEPYVGRNGNSVDLPHGFLRLADVRPRALFFLRTSREWMDFGPWEYAMEPRLAPVISHQPPSMTHSVHRPCMTIALSSDIMQR